MKSGLVCKTVYSNLYKILRSFVFVLWMQRQCPVNRAMAWCITGKQLGFIDFSSFIVTCTSPWKTIGYTL